jgi:hypothetical protein
LYTEPIFEQFWGLGRPKWNTFTNGNTFTNSVGRFQDDETVSSTLSQSLGVK